jgi:hypothetical protein
MIDIILGNTKLIAEQFLDSDTFVDLKLAAAFHQFEKACKQTAINGQTKMFCGWTRTSLSEIRS